MPDEKLRLVSLTVLGGALQGRRYAPDEVVTEILLGSDPDCHLVLDHPGISPIHARVWADLDQSIVYDTHAPGGVYVNATRVEGQAPVGQGDVLWLGPPQEPGSVCVQCHFEPWVEVLPAGPVVEGLPVEAAPVDAVPIDAYEAVVVEPDASIVEAEASAIVEVSPDGMVAAPPPPEPEPAPAIEARSSGAGPSVEEDPFFVGDAGGAVFVPPPAAAPPDEEELVAEDEAPPAAADVALPPTPEVTEPEPTPEALVAETIADDWVIAETPPPPPAEEPAGDFFVEEEASAIEPTPAIDQAPTIDLPPLAPPPEPVPERAPLPPQPLAAPPPAVSEPPPAPAPASPLPSPMPVSAFVPEAHAVAAGTPTPRPAPHAEAKPPEPRPRPEPAPARRPVSPGAPRPAPARRPAASARPARRPARGAPAWVRPVGLAAAGLVILGGLGFVALRVFGGSVRLQAVEPTRLRVGQRATLTGSGFAASPGGNTVLFDDRPAKVLQASPTRLEVEVPEVVAESGGERRVPVVVRRSGRVSGALDVAVFQGPRLHGISPEAAMPGEEVLLAGAGWGVGATVRFGDVAGQVVEVQSTRIRAVVPEIAGGPGTEAPVVVTVGGSESNAAPFIVGRLPVVSRVSPASVVAGEVIDVSGRGFPPDPRQNEVRLAGVPALVVSAIGDTLKVVVPRLGPGGPARTLEVRVPGSTNVGQAVVQVAAPPHPVGFHFVAEPFAAAPGRPHAVLSTGLGPAFVLASAGGRSAAARAVEAAGRLNAAASALRTTVGLNLEVLGLESSPVLGLTGRPDALLEVTEEDAAAYNEDWTGLRGRGGPVTRARLARWWEAVGRDIVLLTVRGERPQFAAALAPEGRVLAQLFEAAQRTGRPGVPRQVVDEARPALRDGLRILALRVPASVPGLAAAASSALPAAAATPPPARLQLEGTWAGSQVEQSLRQYLTVTFRGGSGSIAYEGGITFTVPLLTLDQPRRDAVHFSVQIRGGVRHYIGTWDGEAITGSISTDAAGQNVVASFELRRR